MAEKFFYIKSNRKINGPFTFEQLEKMHGSSLLSAADMISENKVSWQSAEKFFAAPEKEEAKKNLPLLKTLTINIGKVFFPDFKVPKDEPPVLKEKKHTVKKDGKIVSSPLSSVIFMCWNAPRALKNLQLMREFNRQTKRDDDTSVYAVLGCAFLLFLLFMMFFASIVLYLPSSLNAVWLAALLGAGVYLIFFLENLSLSAIFNIEKLFDCDLLIMQMLLTSTGTFCFALPIAAAAVVGMENLPTALNVLILTFALIAAVGETVNLICGFVEVNRRSFKMKTGALSAVCSLQVIQLLLFGATAWKLFKII